MFKTCIHCGKKYEKPYTCSKKEWSGRKYCSHSCANHCNYTNGKQFEKGFIPWNKGVAGLAGKESPRYTRVEKVCKECGKSFSVRNYRKNTANFCSQKCSHKNRKCENVISKCEECGKEFTKLHNPNRIYKFCSSKCMGIFSHKKAKITLVCAECKKSFSPKSRYFKSQKCCSHKCASAYKDKGKTTLAMRLRTSKRYKEWRTAVFERDNYTCQECGGIGGKLNADHIKPFCLFPELRLNVDNGRTLCEDCHRKTKTFGRKALNFFKNSTPLAVANET